MSEPPSELPPVRLPQNDPWSGLRPHDVVPQSRPLKFAEKLTLRAYLPFREVNPSRGWLLRQSAMNVMISSALFAFFCGLLWFFGNAILAVSTDPEIFIALDPTYAVMAWLALTLGFLVRDQIELHSTIDAWHLIRRVVKFATIERMLQSGMFQAETDDSQGKPE